MAVKIGLKPLNLRWMSTLQLHKYSHIDQCEYKI